MLAVGLILVVLATLLLLAALFGGSDEQIQFDLGPIGLDMTPMVVFLLGAATVLVFVMGLELIRSGVRRARRRRKDTKELNRLNEKLEQREVDRRGDADTLGGAGSQGDTAPATGPSTTAGGAPDTASHQGPDTAAHRASDTAPDTARETGGPPDTGSDPRPAPGHSSNP